MTADPSPHPPLFPDCPPHLLYDKGHDVGAILGWLLQEGRQCTEAETLVDEFGRRLNAIGVPLARSVLVLQLLHPQIRSMIHIWRDDGEPVETVLSNHGDEQTETYLKSPFATLVEDGAQGLRFRLDRMSAPWPYPILEDLAAQGMTDYAAMAVLFTGGRRNAISFATGRPGGFSVADLALLDAVLPALGAVLETLALRHLAATVLDTYVGRKTGARILSGDIRRGTGANVRAVLWYCDLRGFTPLADRLPREELIALLNGYFESMGDAVERHGGEILKFIGDAMLAIFPLTEADERGTAAANRALAAATDALATMSAQNAERAAWGQPTLRCGVALHVGEVMYGNIGSTERLDFTVIGPAVNLVSRIEGLCGRLDRTVLTSADFAALVPPDAPHRLECIGTHTVKGLVEPVEVFELQLRPWVAAGATPPIT
ncbi:adenylate/guanylate cyclase domain-containing protein [Azospirillum griseum]|uniref:Adenylate/guanylate cyclase domain-containing protein n=1 Tax=Azospirillum griseum TaxID=2496639 RepID=A0A3S0K9G8_9PROT|nr:adenylate/guanylate cyclase domain-containing protein [Azospirillum griseum]RTR17794.1 adenylate/guanylate cyclase domain-containing protein [Azospirillum griseum]